MKDSIRETLSTLRKRQTDDENIVRFLYLYYGSWTEYSQCGRQEAIFNKLVDLRKAEKERQRRVQELEKQISKLKEVLESPLETEDQEKLDAELVRPIQTVKGSVVDNLCSITREGNMRNSKLSSPI